MSTSGVARVRGVMGRSRRGRGVRGGFSLAELLIVIVVVGILAAVALPSYQRVTYRARAARVIKDLQTVRTAAHQYQLEHDAWPSDVNRGRVPEAFEPYIDNIEFVGNGYSLDWDNWDPVIGVSVIPEDEGLEAAIVATLQTAEGTFLRLDDRYMYVIEAP